MANYFTAVVLKTGTVVLTLISEKTPWRVWNMSHQFSRI